MLPSFCLLVRAGRRGDVELAADDRLDSGLLGLDVELQGPVHGAVIGDGHAVHPVFLALGQQVRDPDGPVQQAVLGVDVEMDKACAHNYFSPVRLRDGRPAVACPRSWPR